ncbi:MAG TPA: PfkB family carbohydrate kinase [Chthonomonadales bacterium]|nr:PfkB family carbohydrate kinase [Chthonomonadales bacterium]
MDIVCLGEALIDFVALETCVSVAEASGFVKAPGGAPANVAVGAARLGMRAAFLGKVGDDPFGHCLRSTLAANGVETRSMRFSTTARTALAFVSLQADGERDFSFYRHPAADMLYRPSEVDLDLVRGARALHFGSISLIGEPARSATRHAVLAARRAGCIVSYDPNLRPPLWPDLTTAARRMAQPLPIADVVKVSEAEAAFLTGATTPEDGLHRLAEAARRASLVTVTLGAGGALWRHASGCCGVVPGFAVNAIDTTGAGDGFVAGLLARLVQAAPSRKDLRLLAPEVVADAVRYACAVGALTTTSRGAIPALPDREAVERFLETGR